MNRNSVSIGAVQEITKVAQQLKDRAEAAEAKLAALDVPKPESGEIERLEELARGLFGAARCSLRLSGDKCGQCEEYLEQYKARLRSLPSEPLGDK